MCVYVCICVYGHVCVQTGVSVSAMNHKPTAHHHTTPPHYSYPSSHTPCNLTTQPHHTTSYLGVIADHHIVFNVSLGWGHTKLYQGNLGILHSTNPPGTLGCLLLKHGPLYQFTVIQGASYFAHHTHITQIQPVLLGGVVGGSADVCQAQMMRCACDVSGRGGRWKWIQGGE